MIIRALIQTDHKRHVNRARDRQFDGLERNMTVSQHYSQRADIHLEHLLYIGTLKKFITYDIAGENRGCIDVTSYARGT